MDLRDRRLVFDTLFDGHDTGHRRRCTVSQQLACRSLAAEALDEACRSLDRASVHEPIEPYVAFALEVCPEADVPAGVAPRWRRAGGSAPSWPPICPTSSPSAASRRIRAQVGYRRWLRRRGVTWPTPRPGSTRRSAPRTRRVLQTEGGAGLAQRVARAGYRRLGAAPGRLPAARRRRRRLPRPVPGPARSVAPSAGTPLTIGWVMTPPARRVRWAHHHLPPGRGPRACRPHAA